MSVSRRTVKKANSTPEMILDDMLKRSFERFDNPRPAKLEKFDVLKGFLPTHVDEANLALLSLVFTADARFQGDNFAREEDNHSWATIVRTRFHRKNGQIRRIFSPEYVDAQDLLAREVKEAIAEVNPGLELYGPDYAMRVATGKLILPSSIEAPTADIVPLSISREVA